MSVLCCATLPGNPAEAKGQSTVYDERPEHPPLFILFGIPVTVSLWHFVWMLVIFSNLFAESAALGAGAILLGFFSTLMHELGHAFVSLAFGLRPAVALIGMGGLCYHRPAEKSWHNMLIVIAGPAMNFVLAGAFYGLLVAASSNPSLDGDALVLRWLQLGIWVNTIWGIYNLLPIFPLDGGALVRTVLNHFMPRGNRADKISFAIGTGAAALAGLWMLQRGATFGFFFLAMAAVQNFQMFNAVRDSGPQKPKDNPEIPRLMAAAREQYQQQGFAEAIRLCHLARAEPGGTRDQQLQLWQILALSSAQLAQWDDAIRFAERVPGSAEMAQVQAYALERLGDEARIRRFLTSPESSLLPPERLTALQGLLHLPT